MAPLEAIARLELPLDDDCATLNTRMLHGDENVSAEQ